MKHAINAIAYTLAFLAISLIASTIVHGLTMLIVGSEVATTPNMLIATSVLSSLTVLGVFIFLHWADVSRSYMQSRPWGVFAWCTLAACGILIPSLCIQEHMPELPNIVTEELEMLMKDRWGYLVIGILAPLAEELVFRGAVLRSLLLWKPGNHWLCIAVSALLFAAAHLNPAQMPHAFLIGLLLGWLYYRTRSIAPGVVYHWVNNSLAYIIYNLYPDPDIRLIDILGSQRSEAAAVLFSLFILLPSLYQLHLRLRNPEQTTSHL